MVLVDPSQQPATRRLPLPDFHGEAGRRREMQPTLRQRAGLVGDRRRPAAVGVITRNDNGQVREQGRELILEERAFVSAIVPVVEDVPTVLALDERQVLERTGRIFPRETEVDPLAVMHRPNLDGRVTLAAEIAAEAGEHGDRLGQPPRRIGRIAVEDRCGSAVNARNVKRVLQRRAPHHDQSNSRDPHQHGHQQRACCRNGLARSWRRTAGHPAFKHAIGPIARKELASQAFPPMRTTGKDRIRWHRQLASLDPRIIADGFVTPLAINARCAVARAPRAQSCRAI